MQFHHMMAFTKDGAGGNPAGVVLDADDMTKAQMQAEATKARYPETAFVLSSTAADLRALFFTPTQPVDLCGHATIALLSLLSSSGRLPAGRHTLETVAGILDVEIRADGTVFYSQVLPTFESEIVDESSLAQTLGVSIADLGFGSLTTQIVRTVSTDMRDMLVPVRSVKILQSIRPDFQAIEALSRLHNVAGLHVYAMDHAGNKPLVACRNFSPAVGIPEEAATGTLCGVTACALKNAQQMDQNTIVFHQGTSVGSPSEILVNVKMNDRKVDELWVGGRSREISK